MRCKDFDSIVTHKNCQKCQNLSNITSANSIGAIVNLTSSQLPFHLQLCSLCLKQSFWTVFGRSKNWKALPRLWKHWISVRLFFLTPHRHFNTVWYTDVALFSLPGTDQTVCQQGRFATHLYFVVRGECNAFKTLHHFNPQGTCFLFHVSCSMLVFVVPLYSSDLTFWCSGNTRVSFSLFVVGHRWTPQEKAMQWAEQAAIPATAVLPCRWGDWARGIVLACNAPGVRITPKTWNTTSV